MSFASSDELLGAVIEELNGLDTTIRILRHFPNGTKPLPLNKITLTAGSNGRSIYEEYIGNQLTEDLRGRAISLDIEIAAYVPFSMNSTLAFEALDKAVGSLTKNKRLGIIKVKYGKLTASREIGGYELHATLTASLYETEG